jgi:hypothetical protein
LRFCMNLGVVGVEILHTNECLGSIELQLRVSMSTP